MPYLQNLKLAKLRKLSDRVLDCIGDHLAGVLCGLDIRLCSSITEGALIRSVSLPSFFLSSVPLKALCVCMCVSCRVVYRAPTMVVSGMKPRGLCLFLLGNHEKFSRSSKTWYLVHPGFPAPSHTPRHPHVSHLSDELCWVECGRPTFDSNRGSGVGALHLVHDAPQGLGMIVGDLL